jgi:hypothetical protein
MSSSSRSAKPASAASSGSARVISPPPHALEQRTKASPWRGGRRLDARNIAIMHGWARPQLAFQAEVVDGAAAAAGAGVEDALAQVGYGGLDGLVTGRDGGGGDVDGLLFPRSRDLRNLL